MMLTGLQRFILLVLAASLCALPLSFAGEVRTGTLTFEHPETGKPVVLFYVKSEAYDPAHPPVVVMHGMNRNPWDYRDAWIELAGEYDFFVVVPFFSRAEYPGTVGYNLGNVFQSEKELRRRPRAAWSYRIPDIVFDYLRSAGSTTAPGYFAFGHSAGSQFLHRKIGFVPDERMLLAVAANAGWYTFPDLNEPWPYGYGGTGLGSGDLPPYLASNLFILLGDQDTDESDPSLRRTPEAMRQGRHRLERGHQFYQTARKLAAELDVPFNWRIGQVPGIGHDNAGMAPAAARYMKAYIDEHWPVQETP